MARLLMVWWKTGTGVVGTEFGPEVLRACCWFTEGLL